MGKVVSFSNQKGGVGKTTTCVNMSAYLAVAGKKTLLIDLDPQGNATTGLGIRKNELSASSYNLLVEDEPASTYVMPTLIENLDIIPSNIDLAGAEVELVYMKNREKILKEAIAELKDEYDYITIDCPPSLGLLTINALTAADCTIIPIQSEFFALEGLSQLMNTIKLVIKHLNPKLIVDGVVLTMYDMRSVISRQISEQIRKFFGDKVFENPVPRNIRLSEAPSHGVPILLHDPKCAGAKAYRALTNEFIERTKKREEKESLQSDK